MWVWRMLVGVVTGGGAGEAAVLGSVGERDE